MHHSSISASGFRDLDEGQAVEYDGPKGPEAENVTSA